MAGKKPSAIEITDEYVLVKPNNAERMHKFDLDMLPKLQGKAWRENHAGYLITSKWSKKGNTTIRASHLVTGKPKKGVLIDHKDRDRTNNLRENLRGSTSSQNNANRSLKISTSSGYRGVWWSKTHKKWASRISKDGKRQNLGYHDNAIEMARAYDAAAIITFGEFALTNKMLGLLKDD